MAAIAESLRTYAVRRWPIANHKWRIGRLASILGFSERRVRSLYAGEATAVLRQHEAEAIQTLIKEKVVADQAFETRIAALEAELAALRAEMVGEALAARSGSTRGPRPGAAAPGARVPRSGQEHRS